MKELAQFYREAQLYAHMAHNMASGPTFFQDHAFFGELYDAYESAYDSIVERMIGLNVEADMASLLVEINQKAAKDAPPAHSNDACFLYLLAIESDICKQIAKEVPSSTDGTQNLLQGLADESEKRKFLMGQRLK